MKGSRRAFGGHLTSVIAVSGVAVGVAALMVTLAVMTGFREDIRDKILGSQPHLVVMASGGRLPAGDWDATFSGDEDVKGWSPFVVGQALLRKGGVTNGAVIKGVDPEREKTVTQLHERLYDGAWESLTESKEGVPVLLGKELAKTLNVTVGDEVLLLAPSDGAAMSSLPRFYPFRVTGILETGLYDYDSSLAIVPMDAAQTVFQMQGSWTGLGVRVGDPEDPTGPAMRLQKSIGSSVWVRSWLGMNRNLFAALKLEKVVMFIVLALITLVAAFMIVSNLLLVTAQRVHEIGILRAMGAARASIGKIFLIKGFLMGAFGTSAGLALGAVISWALKRYQFIQLPADVYYVETLPVRVLASDVGLVAGAALGIVLLATVYPARLAAKLDTLGAIRQI